MFQGCSLEVDNGEEEETEDLKELEPNLERTEAELRHEQKYHHFTQKRLERIKRTHLPQPMMLIRRAPLEPGKDFGLSFEFAFFSWP